MAARKAQDPRPSPPIVRYAPLGELRVYEISESELEKLEAGQPGQIHLSLALAMLPTALTILITLQTVPIEADRLYNGYLFAFWVLLVQGMISLVRWWFSSRSHSRLIREIRSRMPVRPVAAEQLPAPPLLIEETRRDEPGS